MRRRLTWALGLVSVLVFLVVCGIVAFEARRDRTAVELRVGWLMALSGGPHRAGEARAAALAVTTCEDCREATRTTARALLLAPGSQPPIEPLVLALRSENAAFSRELGAAWGTVEVLLGGAVVFALGFLVLLRHSARRTRQMARAWQALSDEKRQREAAQAQLHQHEAFSAGLFDFAPVGIQVFDADGLCVRMNPEQARILGLPSTETGVGVFNIRTDPFALATGTAARIAPAFSGEIVEIRGRSVDFGLDENAWPTHRGVLVLDQLYFPIRDASGRVSHVVALYRDDTEAHETRGRLALSERLATVGTLAAGVAHEINNPLAFISSNIGWIGSVLEERRDALPGDLWPALDEALKDATDGVRRVRAIVRDLGTFSGPPRTAPAVVSLRAMVEPTLRILAHELRNRATVRNEIPRDLSALADPQALGQVMLNLVQNAAHAIDPGEPASHRITLTGERLTGGRVRLTVRDTGHGIPPEVAARVFDPFFTTKPVGQGTGLGLSLSRGLVLAMSGRLTFESTPGQGSAFHVDLPGAGVGANPTARTGEDVGASKPAPAPIGLSSGGTGRRDRILVIDDEPLLAASLRRLLAPRVEVVGETSGVAALERIAGDTNWSAILLDVMMPEMDGIEVLEALRGLAPDLVPRVILMTGGTFSTETDALWAAYAGPRLTKPFEPEALQAALRAVSGGAENRRDSP
ncbi:ATP-binding protein [Myxococcota bacterium]|nr:ATP-binding protein [Myxococcota bacterium]